MEFGKYLMCVAMRHEQARNQHMEELKEHRLSEKNRRRRSLPLTYADEAALLEGVFGSLHSKPASLKRVSLHAIAVLAYVFKAKLTNDLFMEGHRIINKLVCDPEKIFLYLEAFTELKEQGWVQITDPPGMGFADQPPFCWMQSTIELGDNFHDQLGAATTNCPGFSSNEVYLDAVLVYLQLMVQDDGNLYRVTEPKTDLSTFQPEGWFRKIALRENASTCLLPAVEARKKYSLSIIQQLTLIGLLGMRDGDLHYDFSSPADVTHLFARGQACRKLMREHLFGAKSPLIQQRLLAGSHGPFGESVQLTPIGNNALLGKNTGKKTAQELKAHIQKSTLFDFEEPKVKKDALLLPTTVKEAIQTILFSESRPGRKIRKTWQASLPSTSGSPIGSTVLLYGPSGTGKTLTARFLAAELKLPLLKIDAARVLSCWVGESEGNVRRIFDDYSALQEEMGIAPVLLLNEADQLLGVRGAGINAVDRMNNNMQNLFLEGLERFSGILVATTNRQDLLDEAFSRRFTYKLELPPPDRDLRIELWKSHLPMKRLADDVKIAQLADLGLTGGEIRLVVERAVRLQAYRGSTNMDSQTLIEIAKEELNGRMTRNGHKSKIGFIAVPPNQKERQL